MVLKWHHQALLRLLPLNLSSLIRINHSKNQEISKVMWKLPIFCCLVPSNAGLVWNRKGGLIIKRKKANLLIFYGCLVLLYRLHVSVSLGLSIGFHFSQLEVNKSGHGDCWKALKTGERLTLEIIIAAQLSQHDFLSMIVMSAKVSKKRIMCHV